MNLNIEDMRIRYAVSLYGYGKMKQSYAVDSEHEHRGRLKPKEILKKKTL